MAEILGIVSDSVGIATAFSACVEGFDYVHIGRRFGTDFETKSLTISLLQLRLSRWGEAVNIYEDPQFDDSRATSDQLELARDAVTHILHLLEDSKRFSERHGLPAESTSGALTSVNREMSGPLMRIGDKTRNIVVHRQKQAGLLKLMAWAIYDKKHFSRLVEDVSEMLDRLESAFPAPQRRSMLAQEEVRQIKSEVDDVQATTIFSLLEDLSGKVDQVLENELKAGPEINGHCVNRAELGDEYDTSVGRRIDSAWQGVQALPQGGGFSSIGFLKGGNEGKLFIGNSYNGWRK